MFDWFYTQNGEQQGPVTEQELRQLAASGQLQPSDLVWHQQLPEWIPLSSWLSGGRRPGDTTAHWPGEKGGRKGLIIGGIVGILLIGGGLAFFLSQGKRSDNGGAKKENAGTTRSFSLSQRNAKSFTVKFAKDKWVKLKAKSKNHGQFRLFIFTANARRVAARESQHGEIDIDLVPDLTQSYRIQVSALNAPVQGDFSWTLDSPAEIIKSAKRPPFNIQDVLQTNDPIFLVEQNLIIGKTDQPRYFKYHFVHFDANKFYTIDLESTWDNYLYIRDLAGHTITKDDDGGEGLNARIQFRPAQTGVYRVIVTSFANQNLGAYTLRISGQ